MAVDIAKTKCLGIVTCDKLVVTIDTITEDSNTTMMSQKLARELAIHSYS